MFDDYQNCQPTMDTPKYSLSFPSDKDIIVNDGDGNRIAGQQVKYPEECTVIHGIKTFTVIEAKVNPHYIIVYNDGTPTKYMLSHQ